MEDNNVWKFIGLWTMVIVVVLIGIGLIGYYLGTNSFPEPQTQGLHYNQSLAGNPAYRIGYSDGYMDAAK